MNLYEGRLCDYMRQTRQAQLAMHEMLRLERGRLKAEGYKLTQLTTMFEEWTHPDGRKVILE